MLGGAGFLPSTVCHSSDLNLPCFPQNHSFLWDRRPSYPATYHSYPRHFRTELVILWCIIVGLRNYLIICKNNITEKLLQNFEGLLKLTLESAGFLSVRFSNVWSFIDPSQFGQFMASIAQSSHSNRLRVATKVKCNAAFWKHVQLQNPVKVHQKATQKSPEMEFVKKHIASLRSV